MNARQRGDGVRFGGVICFGDLDLRAQASCSSSCRDADAQGRLALVPVLGASTEVDLVGTPVASELHEAVEHTVAVVASASDDVWTFADWLTSCEAREPSARERLKAPAYGLDFIGS